MLLWTDVLASKSVEIGSATYPSVMISIVLLSFVALLVGFYVLYRYHRKRARGFFSQKPATLTDEWLAQQVRSAVAADNPVFGGLFAGPVKDEHTWVLLKEFNHHLLWVCLQNAWLGFWTLNAEGAPQWRIVQLHGNSLNQYLRKQESTEKGSAQTHGVST
ncbi:hypothetical protein HF563_15190 [Acidithiobacillus ferridurans]|nr:hypothetical protein [Acidithiobacillus ferridurans]MBU2731500.1 hypothetical protein [Acidithiobacillus ferridurans]